MYWCVAYLPQARVREMSISAWAMANIAYATNFNLPFTVKESYKLYNSNEENRNCCIVGVAPAVCVHDSVVLSCDISALNLFQEVNAKSVLIYQV